MTTKHTKGPWQVQIVHAAFTQYEIVHTDGELKSLIGCTFKENAICPEHGGDDISNALLIAAAPELLEACRAAEKAISGNGQWVSDENQNVFLMLCKVISKAEGTL